MQRKRVHFATGTGGVGTQFNLTGTIDESNGVNAHGLFAQFICEPQDADANANGQWALWCLPDEASAVPATSNGALETEASNAFLWACGNWAASNQTPYCSEAIRPKTSRNCQNGARIVLSVVNNGVSAGLVQCNRSLCYFTKSL